MKNKLFGIGILFALFLGFSASANAQETPAAGDTQTKQYRKGFGKFKGDKAGKHGGKHGKHGDIFRAVNQLDLTEAQRAQIKSIAESNKTAIQPQREEMRGLMEAKRNGGTLTEVQQARFNELKEQMRENGNKMKEEVLAVLTPEQKTKLEEMKAKMREMREQRKQMREQRGVPSTKEEPKSN